MSIDQIDRSVRGPRIGFGRSSEVFAYGSRQVLKLYRIPWEPAAVLNEFEATKLAWNLGLPVPEPVRIVEEDGRTGIVFERLEGRSVMGRFARNPIRLLIALRHMARLQQRIHACDASHLPSQQEMLRGQIARARVSDSVKRSALSVLDRLPDGTSLCHGDLHPENAICTPQGLYVVDWQKARAGSPSTDVARTALILRHGRLDLGRLGAFLPMDTIRHAVAFLYLWRYAQLTGTPLAELRAWQLPLLVSRLFGQAASNEDEVRAEAERLARRTEIKLSRQLRTTAVLLALSNGLAFDLEMTAIVFA
ncbi:phosphotransferase family protein [Methylobacterium planeticum]|uniref:Phosphotransferase n=1 Tax=Methylobacterium planeticum TaxID=2615211 RepID=A0A6N6MNX0_9HYPH|nr:aminoglycoside phosphotransferase family protein [Methylobacterium planeticum]KAB1072606.1 phosphotransferase [Methylobacterium planeticum]